METIFYFKGFYMKKLCIIMDETFTGDNKNLAATCAYFGNHADYYVVSPDNISDYSYRLFISGNEDGNYKIGLFFNSVKDTMYVSSVETFLESLDYYFSDFRDYLIDFHKKQERRPIPYEYEIILSVLSYLKKVNINHIVSYYHESILGRGVMVWLMLYDDEKYSYLEFHTNYIDNKKCKAYELYAEWLQRWKDNEELINA
jgi:hypothetical protein